MVMLSCRKGSGHWEKPTCTAQTGLSLEAGVSLEGSQGLIAPMYVKDDSTLDWVQKLRPYLLESFCPVFYNTMYFAIYLPETIFSSFFCQLLSCLFSAHILQRYFWVETPDVQSWQTGTSVSLQGAVRNTNSADAVCGEDKAGGVVKGGKEGALIQAIDAALVTWSNRTLWAKIGLNKSKCQGVYLAARNGKLSPAWGGRAPILESRDSGKVRGMENCGQTAEAEQPVRAYSWRSETRNGKWAVWFAYRAAAHSHKLLRHGHMPSPSETRGEDWTWLSQCAALLGPQSFVKSLAARNPRGSAASQKYPLLRENSLLLEAGSSWQSWRGCGLSCVTGQVNAAFLYRNPVRSCQWQAVSLWEHLPSISKAALPLFCVWNSLQWLMVPEKRITRV